MIAALDQKKKRLPKTMLKQKQYAKKLAQHFLKMTEKEMTC